MAAGESQRMKGIKQLLPWKGTTLLGHTINTLKNVQQKFVFVVLGAYQEEIMNAFNLNNEGVSIIENTNWKDGLGSSIACGVKHVLNSDQAFDGFLICLADQPLLDYNYYKTIITEFNSGKKTIVASKYKGKIGVPALFHKTIASELLTLKADYGAKEILSKHATQITVVNPEELVRDIDTNEQYLELYNKYN